MMSVIHAAIVCRAHPTVVTFAGNQYAVIVNGAPIVANAFTAKDAESVIQTVLVVTAICVEGAAVAVKALTLSRSMTVS